MPKLTTTKQHKLSIIEENLQMCRQQLKREQEAQKKIDNKKKLIHALPNLQERARLLRNLSSQKSKHNIKINKLKIQKKYLKKSKANIELVSQVQELKHELDLAHTKITNLKIQFSRILHPHITTQRKHEVCNQGVKYALTSELGNALPSNSIAGTTAHNNEGAREQQRQGNASESTNSRVMGTTLGEATAKTSHEPNDSLAHTILEQDIKLNKKQIHGNVNRRIMFFKHQNPWRNIKQQTNGIGPVISTLRQT